MTWTYLSLHDELERRVVTGGGNARDEHAYTLFDVRDGSEAAVLLEHRESYLYVISEVRTVPQRLDSNLQQQVTTV